MNYKIQGILNLLQMVQKQGVDVQRLCHLSGLNPEDLKTGRLPELPIVNQLWLNAIKLTGDRYLGLHIGEEGGLASLGLVGQLIQTSATIEEAVQHTCEFVNLITEAFKLTMSKDNATFSIVFEIDENCWQHYRESVKQNVDTALVFSMAEYNALTLGKVRPVAVYLPWSRPSDDQEYNRVFNTQIFYQQPAASISFDNKLLGETIVSADYELMGALVKHARRLKDSNKTTDKFSALVRQTVINQSYIYPPKVTDVAATLNMSVRTLQRRLKAENTTFQDLQDGVRKELAKQYLKQKMYPIKEISYILGYNEVSAFNRSFKRWTGLTPLTYQNKQP